MTRTTTTTTRSRFRRAHVIEVVQTPPTPSPRTTSRRPPSLNDLRDLVSEVAVSIALLPGGDPEAQRRARLLIDALSPIVRLPTGGAAVPGDAHVVALREIHVLQRWLGRATGVPEREVVRAYARIDRAVALA